MDHESPVIVEKTLDAPAQAVWKALTDKNEMKEWYFNPDHFQLKEGFEFRFAGEGHKGEKYMHICVISEIIPQKKLQYSWKYEGMAGFSIVSFELTPLGNQTRLKLTQNPNFAPASFREGWNHILGVSLPGYLTKVWRRNGSE
jgi:uncharacterized protein YndB with AHSA1/START domain